jgi:hypothetical protein
MSDRRRTAATVTTAIADAVAALGVVVGFNQLATQSPVDAVLPVALITVGLAGLVSALAGAIGAGTAPDDGAEPHAFAPPPADVAGATFALAVVAIAAVTWRWGIAAQAAVVGAQGLSLLIRGGVSVLPSRRPSRVDPYRSGLLTVEGALLVGFALAALADAGIRPFS